MFGHQLYPTPVDVIDKMLEPHLREFSFGTEKGTTYLSDIKIIDPSAGKGDILDRCHHWQHHSRHYSRRSERKTGLYAIEIDPNLRSILRDKGYEIIGTNFLDYDDPFRFDLWLMNPPFDKGIDHLLHAWNIMGSGQVVCIINSSNLDQDTAKVNTLKNIVEVYGSIEDIGQPFKDAERATDVNVSLVRLNKPSNEDKLFIHGLTHDDVEQEASYQSTAIMTGNPYQQLVGKYLGARAAIEEQHQAMAKYRWFVEDIKPVSMDEQLDEYQTKLIGSGKDNDEIAEAMATKRDAILCEREHTEESSATKSLAEDVAELKKKFWRYVFAKTRVAKMTSSTTQKKFEKMREEYESLSFTYENIQLIAQWLKDNQETMVTEAIVTAFDALTKYPKNTIAHTEGWHTNSGHRVNKKVIIPNGVCLDGTYYSSSHRTRELYEDLDKALCFISGTPQDEIHTLYTAISNRESGHDGEKDSHGKYIHVHYTEPLQSTFFKIRLFKKGTVHLTFLDLNLLEQFNSKAAAAKGWLPGGRGW